MAWQTPKTNWGAADVPLPDDFNRIEGNVQELQNTKETPAGAQAKANTAEANAKAYTDAHEQKAAPHSGHETPAGAQAKAEAAAGAVQADLDTHKAEKATDVALGHVIVDNDTIQSDEDGVISVPDGVFQSADSASGNATYTDNMAAGATLTKNIALGSANYKQGIAVIKSSTYVPGIMVFFTTVNTETLVTGIVKISSDNAGSAWSRRVVGQVTDATKYGYAAVSGYFRMVIKEVYIDGSNLVLQFHNGESDACSLNCTIDWRVW